MAATKSESAAPTKQRTPKQFLRKYFLEGQKHLHGENVIIKEESTSSFDDLFNRHRKFFGIFIPFIFFQTVYWLIAFRYHVYEYFKEKYVMSIVMVFGALIGGMTTEGGGAVAFPVMTLALHISPVVARDFSLMIQSCGLSAASFTIFFTGILVEWHSILFSTAGAIFGVVFGLQAVDPLMTPAEKKMAFVSVFFSFALALFILNSEKKRITFNCIQQFSVLKALILVVNGFVGGIFTGVAGSGIDVYSFSILTLLFRITEKVATPTSVVLMATNSMVGFFWRYFMQNAIQQESWEYFAVCLPIVVIFAPVGSFIASYLHRLTLATLIYVLETVALFSAVVIIRPGWALLLASFGLIIGSFAFYSFIGYYGRQLTVRKIQAAEKMPKDLASVVVSSGL